MSDHGNQGEPLAVTQIEAARLLKVSEQTLRNWRRKGKLKATRPGNGKVLYSVETLKALVK